LAPLLQHPETQHGRLMLVKGTARRVLRVRVDEPDIQDRFGIDHYYQIDVFVPLGDQVVQLGKDAGPDSPTFTNNFPVTVCVAELPPDLHESPDLREDVSIPAANFKLWAYHSQFVTAYDKHQLQVSPMFIGAMPAVIHYRMALNPYISLAVAAVFIALLGCGWLVVWRSSRGDSKFKRSVLDRQFEVEPGRSLNDNEIAARDKPDFSNLD